MMMDTKHAKLHLPALDELCTVLSDGLSKHFKNVSVTVEDCPNLEEEPFHLAAKGICGNPRLADIGGVPYLVPLVRRDKIYDFSQIAKDIDLPEAFIIGAGAGPHHHIGVNAELIPNVKLGAGMKNNTHFVKVKDDGGFTMAKLGNTGMCLLANIFASDGKPGKVLKVVAKHRNANASNFVTVMRLALKDKYGDQPVGMGGVFLLDKGKAKIHVMPNFSETPLKTEEDVNSWLKFYEVSGPLIVLSTFISSDPGLDLRVEHSHCFSTHGDGGHYHWDVTPETVEYEGYFNPAEFIYRIDPPAETHLVGRD